jgi:hypothetical protein
MSDDNDNDDGDDGNTYELVLNEKEGSSNELYVEVIKIVNIDHDKLLNMAPMQTHDDILSICPHTYHHFVQRS